MVLILVMTTMVAFLFKVILELDPIANFFLVLVVACWTIFLHLFDIVLFQMALHLIEQVFLLVTELCPNLNAEVVFAAILALVKQSDSRNHISDLERAGDHAENEFFPDVL